MLSPNKRLCIFGDSHFACTKLAVDQGLVDHNGIDVEFWGNIGKQFRFLAWRNEQIEPLDDFTAGRFAKTNAKSRTVLNSADYDAIFFMGARIDVFRLFPEALHRLQTPSMRLSSAVERRWISDFMRRQPPYQFARRFAAQKQARIIVNPVSLETDGFAATIPPEFQAARGATPARRKHLWDKIEHILAEDGLELLRQPEETIVGGCCTDPTYAVRQYFEREDRTHKNAQYGAIILNDLVAKLRGDWNLKG